MTMLKEIRAFCAVARLGSLTRAAEQLGTSQPSISRWIFTLEEELGVGLIVHGSKPLRLTETGAMVAKLSEPYLKSLFEITNQAHGVAGASHLSIVTLRPYHNLVMPRVLHEFQAQYPEVKIRLHARTRREASLMLEEGSCEFGILTDQDLAPQFEFDYLSDFPILLAAQVDHPLLQLSPVTLQDITQYPVVLRRKGIWTRDFVDSVLEQHHLRYRVTTEVDTVEMALRLTALGQAVTFVSPVIDVRTINPNLRVRPLPNVFPSRRMGVVTLKSQVLSRVATSFIDVLRFILKNDPAGDIELGYRAFPEDRDMSRPGTKYQF
jgi:DNA-binding transcriptional LysR family regulator